MATPMNASASNEQMQKMYNMDSMSNATIGNARALFGILFIQYCSYAFFYIMDHLYEIYPDYYTQLKFNKDGQPNAQGGAKDKNAGGQQAAQGAEEEDDGEDDDDDEEEGEEDDEDDGTQQKRAGAGQMTQDQQQRLAAQQAQARQQKYQQNAQIEKIDEDDDDSEEEEVPPHQGRQKNYEGGQKSGSRKGKPSQREIQLQQQQQKRGQQQQEDSDEEYDGEDDEPQQQPKRQQMQQQPKLKLSGSNEQMQASIKEAMAKKIKNQYEYAFAKKLSSVVKSKTKLEDMTEDELEAFEKWEKSRLQSISNQVVEYFPQIMMWHTMIVSMCAIRSPVDFAVSCTLFAMLMRIVMVFGFYCNKKIVYIAASGLEIFCNFCLLFVTMGYSQYN